MSSHVAVEDHRPQPGRHRLPEPAGPPVPPPAWAADEHARPIDLVGDGPTRVLHVPPPLTALAMPLSSRHPQAARWWEVRLGQLGQALTALRGRWSQ